MRAPQASGLRPGRAPAVEEVALLIELENAARSRLSDPDEAVLIVVDGQRFRLLGQCGERIGHMSRNVPFSSNTCIRS